MTKRIRLTNLNDRVVSTVRIDSEYEVAAFLGLEWIIIGCYKDKNYALKKHEEYEKLTMEQIKYRMRWCHSM